MLAPPTVRLLRGQVAVAKYLADTSSMSFCFHLCEVTFTTLLDLVNRSSTQVPLFTPRTMQPVYSL